MHRMPQTQRQALLGTAGTPQSYFNVVVFPLVIRCITSREISIFRSVTRIPSEFDTRDTEFHKKWVIFSTDLPKCHSRQLAPLITAFGPTAEFTWPRRWPCRTARNLWRQGLFPGCQDRDWICASNCTEKNHSEMIRIQNIKKCPDFLKKPIKLSSVISRYFKQNLYSVGNNPTLRN